MWAPPGGQLRDRGPSNNFADSPMVGADDCLPTVGACTIDGVEYADHGEVWQQPWSVRNYDLPRSCTMAVELDTHGIRMERHATADGSCLRLEYSVDRTRPTTLPWLWSWHPLFVVPMLPRLEVEGVIGTPRVESCHGVSTSDTRLSLPAACDHSAVRTLDLGGQNRSAKLFLDAENEGAATLHDDANGAFLRVSWKGEALRGLGLWINRGGWNGYHHVAVEPCTAPVESPADLCDPSDCPESAKWTIEVELG